MSLFDTIGSLLGKSDGSSTSVPEALVAALGGQEGGLGGLVEKFQAAGLGNVIASWVGTGANQPVAPDALHGILGSELVQQIAGKTGLPVEQLLPLIAQHLPQLIDGMTPNGQVPSGGGSLLDAGLAFLKSRMAEQPSRLYSRFRPAVTSSPLRMHSGEARSRNAPATLSGGGRRLGSSPGKARVRNRVRTTPGSIRFARTPVLATSAA